jgi:hypothetical protein
MNNKWGKVNKNKIPMFVFVSFSIHCDNSTLNWYQKAVLNVY